MATVYTYSKSADFGGTISAGQFATEIDNESLITTPLISVNVVLDDVNITFASALSVEELVALDALVVGHDPNPNNIIFTTDASIDISTTLADGNAITISATNAVGGISIDAGNGISIDGGAACNFTSTGGNLTLSSNALVNVDGDVGVNVGAGLVDKVVNIGNTVGTTNTNILGGTGGVLIDSTGAISLDASGATSNYSLATTANGQDLIISLTGSTDSSIIIDSSGTGADSIRLRSDGGMDIDATDGINMATGVNVGGAITLDTSFNNGGIILSAGNLGIGINCSNGIINMGTSSEPTVNIGNVSGATSVNLLSGTGGLNIGGNFSTGNISIGDTFIEKTVILGNATGNSRTFYRKGLGGFMRTQQPEAAFGDFNNIASVSNLLSEILTQTPSTTRTMGLPDASVIVSGISGIAVNDSIDFYVINESNVDGANIQLVMGTGGTIIGNPIITPRENSALSNLNSGSGHFRLRMTNVTASSETYNVYRLA